MIVIIEGLDCCGKTTICDEIANKYNFKYIKESYTNNCEEKECRMINMLTRLTENKNYIYDRTTLIDDFVYSFLNETRSSLLDYFEIIIKILSKCKIIHLELDEQIRKQRFNKRGDQYITDDDIKKIVKQYKQFYQNLNNVQYIKLSGDLNKDVEQIMEVIDYESN